MAGYSNTPLWRKLGYTAGSRAWLTGSPPADYKDLLQLPPEIPVIWLKRPEPALKFVHVFATEADFLREQLKTLRPTIAPDGVVWISWPKKASRVPTDITEDTIRTLALPLDFVDIKVCAVDQTWSGLKLMIRKTAR